MRFEDLPDSARVAEVMTAADARALATWGAEIGQALYESFRGLKLTADAADEVTMMINDKVNESLVAAGLEPDAAAARDIFLRALHVAWDERKARERPH